MFFIGFPKIAAAGNGDYLVRGAAKTMFATMEIPRSMISQSTRAPFPVGLVTGAISGVFRTALGIVSGAADLARGAAPYAKYAVFFA